jgi:spore germination protein GerM
MDKRKTIIVLVVIAVIIVLLLLISNRKDKNTELIDPNEENIRVVQIALYFKDNNTQKLDKEYRFVNIEDVKVDVAGTIMKELTNGPTYENLVATMPTGTKVNNIEIKNNQIILDVSKEFMDNKSSNLEDQTLTIFSVVNSLTEIKEIDQVRFLVDGKEVEKYGDVNDFNKPFGRNL